MDKGRRAHSNEQLGNSSTRVWSSDISIEPWHSTPVKKNNGGVPADSSRVSIRNEMDRIPKKLAKSAPPFSTDIPCLPILQDSQIPVVDMESATIQRQRRELQLLIAELKDRDRELNTMAASHHKQLQAWEQDRQRVLTLEQRCSRFNDELQKRNEVIRVLTKRVQIVETREKEVQKELSVTQQQLHRLGQKQQHASQKYQDFEEKNQSLNLTVMALSTQVGSLQVREEELSAMLKLKDKDVNEATTNIVDLTARLRDLETSLKESRSRESRLLRDLEENKCRYREARHENTYLKEEVQQHITQSSAQREEIIRLKQEQQLLRRDLALSGEGDSWKDELLVLARSKQERTESELHCLRQVCENQQNDLQLLQLNLESAREAIREKNSQGSLGREATVLESMKILGTDREEESPRRQVISKSSEPKQNAQNTMLPMLITERNGQRAREEYISGLSFDATDVSMVASELTHNSSTTYILPLDQTSGGPHDLPGPTENHRTSGFYTPSPLSMSTLNHSYQASQDRKSIDSLIYINADADTQSRGNTASKIKSCLFPGNESMAPICQDQLSGEYQSMCNHQDQGRSRTETVETSGIMSRLTASFTQSSQGPNNFTASRNPQGKAGRQDPLETESLDEGSPSYAIDHTSNHQETSGRTEDTETGWNDRRTRNAGSLDEGPESMDGANRQTTPSSFKTDNSGDSELTEGNTGLISSYKTTSGRDSGTTDQNSYGSSNTAVGQAEPQSYRTASCDSSIKQTGSSCGCISLCVSVVGQTATSSCEAARCGHSSNARGRAEANSLGMTGYGCKSSSVERVEMVPSSIRTAGCRSSCTQTAPSYEFTCEFTCASEKCCIVTKAVRGHRGSLKTIDYGHRCTTELARKHKEDGVDVNCDCSCSTSSCEGSGAAQGQTGPSCECAGGAESQREANPGSSGLAHTEIALGTGAEMNLVAVFNGSPEAKTSPILLLDISPRPQQSPNYTCQDHLKCGCLDNLSPSPIRMRNSGPGNDIATLPMVNQQGTVNSELGVFSAASTDGGSPFATCCLQRLLDESRQMVASLERTGQRPLSSLLNNDSVISLNISQDSGRTDPPHRHTCQSSPYHEVCETPPSTCPQHSNKEPCRQPDIH